MFELAALAESISELRHQSRSQARLHVGPNGGWTYGGELSVPIRRGEDLHAIVAVGPALNLAWTSRGTTELRLGLELVSWFVGVEAGPSLVRDRSGNHFGFGIQAWASGIRVAGEYTHVLVVGGPSLDELGVYGKLPLCFVCSGGGGGGVFGHDFDHHH